MKKIYTIIFCLGCLAGSPGCANTENDTSIYLGTWRLQNQTHQYTIMSLKNNGTFETDLRIEGQMSKIIEKKGRAAGTWEAKKTGDRFILNITRGDPSIGWQTGEQIYRIGRLDRTTMVLVSADGREYRWEKNGVHAEDTPEMKDIRTLTLAPLVVNLMPGKSRASQRYKWLCLRMDLQLSPEGEQPSIEARWQNVIITVLSSKTYEEVNAPQKVEVMANELRDLLNPYLNGRVNKVVINKMVVTGRQEAVDAFYAENKK